jgi:hypothetical protein
MKKLGIAMLALAAGMASVPVYAMDMGQGARFGAGLGRYSGEATAFIFDFEGNPLAIPCPPEGEPVSSECRQEGVTATFGGELGYTINLADFYADIGLNLLRTKSEEQNLWRTDLLFTLGYYLTENWSIFAGVRRGWQGDGVFNDDQFEELGPYVGFGYGGIPLGGWGTLNMSAAYNFDKVENYPIPVEELDYGGISLKFGMNFRNTPHSLQLRLQRFSGDDTVEIFDTDSGNEIPDGTFLGRFDYELEETWAVLSYVYTLAW